MPALAKIEEKFPARTDRKRAGPTAYVLAMFSFVPLFGVPVGLGAVAWGISRRSWPLVWMGSMGILLTIVIYAWLFYSGFEDKGGLFARLRQRMAVQEMTALVPEIEYYKVKNGHYPARLQQIVSIDSEPDIRDPTQPLLSGMTFSYRLDPSGKFYYLRSVGADGVPFTADDLLPTISEDERKKTGLQLER